jgi:hypothetical protein
MYDGRDADRDGQRSGARIMNAIVAKAERQVKEISGARKGRVFAEAVEGFITILKTASDPDQPGIDEAEIHALQDLSDKAIELIETRIDSGEDKQAFQRDLATAIYRIRRTFEDVDRWRRPH